MSLKNNLNNSQKLLLKRMNKEKNTNKEFYKHWLREELIKELCRLNQLLIDMLKTIKGADVADGKR